MAWVRGIGSCGFGRRRNAPQPASVAAPDDPPKSVATAGIPSPPRALPLGFRVGEPAMRDGADDRAQARRRFLGGLGLAAVAAPAAAFEADGSTGGLPPKKETEAEK